MYRKPIQINVPIKKRKYKNTPWVTAEVRRARNAKNRAYKKYVETKMSRDLKVFYDLCETFSQVSLEAYQRYLTNIGNDLRNNPKSFWRFVSANKSSLNLPKSMSFLNHTSVDEETKCDLFADFFQTTYERHDMDINSNIGRSLDTLFDINDIIPTTDEIVKGLSSLDPAKKPGPDGIPNTFLGSIRNSIITPLQHIFELSLRSSVFPNSWEHS